jgi:Rieske 2Fe-2S family protein
MPATRTATATTKPSLPGRDYHDPAVFAVERERLFYGMWFCVARADEVAREGSYLPVQVVDESILLVRDADGTLRGFYNVCRHRGARLCDAAGHAPKAIKCPYHAWAFGLDGTLLGTPNVHEDAGFRRADYPLWPVAVETWQGMVFVNLSDNPGTLRDQISAFGEDPDGYEHHDVEHLKSGHRQHYEVASNWKIVIDNYMECLHCPTVHPELVQRVPVFKRGQVVEEDGSDGVRLADGYETLTLSGRALVPKLPGVTGAAAERVFGRLIFPNLIIDYLPDVVITSILKPVAADRTEILTDYLFAAQTIAADDFDPSEIIEFNDLVYRQDNDVCARTQRGVSSRAFRNGVYPPPDAFLQRFTEHYLHARGFVDAPR